MYLGLLAPASIVFALLPAVVSFTVAVASAFVWCYWLERHPLADSSF